VQILPRLLFLAPIAICLFSQEAFADDQPSSKAARMSCPVVRAAVKFAGGLDGAIQQARQRGYTESDIASVVKRCGLK
jgi:hypothetical protein